MGYMVTASYEGELGLRKGSIQQREPDRQSHSRKDGTLILKIMQGHGKNTGEMKGPVGKECGDLWPRTAADAGSRTVQCIHKMDS